ncbi:MAG: phage holin family protein [Bacteroidales bacterium]|nr:phage holin family protein [Bacteroidales bacterium]
MDSINDIKDDLKSIFKDEVKLYTLKGVEKSSLFLGIIATFFIITIFILLGIVFGSIALANYLNIRLDHDFMGYLMVSGADILLAAILLFWVAKRKTPLLTNLFVKAIVSIFNIRDDEDK